MTTRKPKPISDDENPSLTVTYDERGLCLWIGKDALQATHLVVDGPNGPAAPFLIDVDSAHVLLSALHHAIDDRDDLHRNDPDFS